MEGDAERVFELTPQLTDGLVAGYAKYSASHGHVPDPTDWQNGGIGRVKRRKVLGWSNDPRHATRWTFD